MRRLRNGVLFKQESDDTELLAIIIYVVVGFLLFYWGFIYLLNILI